MFDPYHKWLGIAPKDQPPNHYRLLGIDLFESDPDVIDTAANKQMAHLQSCATGPHTAASQKLLNEIAAARLCLLDPKKKAGYDAMLKASQPPVQSKKPASASTTASASDPRVANDFGTMSSPRARQKPKPQEASSKKGLLIGIAGVAAVAVIGGILLFAKPGKDKQPPESAASKEVAVAKTPDLPRQKTEPWPKLGTGTQPKAEPKPKSEPKVNSEPKTKADEPEPKLEAKVEPKAEVAVLDPKPEAKAEPKQEAKTDKMPAPSAEDQAKAEKVIKDIFKDDFFKAKSVAEKTSLAETLIKQGMETKDDLTARFVLFHLASDIAAQAGNHTLGCQAIEEMAKRYEVDPLTLKTAMLTTATKQVAPAAAKELIEAILQLVEDAISSDRFDVALTLAKLADSTAPKAKNITLVTKASAAVKKVQEIQKEADTVKTAVETLKEKPDDPAANLTAGKFFCLLKGDWDKGLPLLAKGSDEKLRTVAQQDLANPSEAATQMKLADDWFLLAGNEAGTKKMLLSSRAYEWYQKALPMLEGLTKAKVEKRVVELEKLSLKLPNQGSISDRISFESKLKKRFHGTSSYDSKTGVVILVYDFNDKKQLLDFDASGSKPVLMKGTLSIGKDERLVHVAQFTTLKLKVEVKGKPDGGFIRINKSAGFWTSKAIELAILDDNGKAKEDVCGSGLPKGENWQVEMNVTKEQLSLKVNDILASKTKETARAGQVELIGFKTGNVFRKLILEGTLDEEWAKTITADGGDTKGPVVPKK